MCAFALKLCVCWHSVRPCIATTKIVRTKVRATAHSSDILRSTLNVETNEWNSLWLRCCCTIITHESHKWNSHEIVKTADGVCTRPVHVKIELWNVCNSVLFAETFRFVFQRFTALFAAHWFGHSVRECMRSRRTAPFCRCENVHVRSSKLNYNGLHVFVLAEKKKENLLDRNIRLNLFSMQSIPIFRRLISVSGHCVGCASICMLFTFFVAIPSSMGCARWRWMLYYDREHMQRLQQKQIRDQHTQRAYCISCKRHMRFHSIRVHSSRRNKRDM